MSLDQVHQSQHLRHQPGGRRGGEKRREENKGRRGSGEGEVGRRGGGEGRRELTDAK